MATQWGGCSRGGTTIPGPSHDAPDDPPALPAASWAADDAYELIAVSGPFKLYTAALFLLKN